MLNSNMATNKCFMANFIFYYSYETLDLKLSMLYLK